MQKFVGTGVALVTPFKSDKTVDFEALIKLVEFNIDNGIDYLVINGTTGESATITKEERSEIIEVIAKVNNKRLPLVLGIGGNNTATVVGELQTTDLTEIDAILSVAPYYSKPTQEGFYEHFKAISLASLNQLFYITFQEELQKTWSLQQQFVWQMILRMSLQLKKLGIMCNNI